jgi:hypothetical protein
MKNLANHFLRKHFDLVLMAFKNHSTKAKQKRRKQVIMEVDLQCDEEQNYVKKNQEIAIKQQKQTRARIEVRSIPLLAKNPRAKVPKAKIEIQEAQLDKMQRILIGRSHSKFFISKKRSVFAEWRQAILTQRQFMNQITNVLSKGMYYKGFNGILEGNRERKSKALMERVLTKHFLVRYQYEFLKQSFNKWKASIFKEAFTELKYVTKEYKETCIAEKQQVVDIKNQNMANVLHFYRQKQKHRIWLAWQKTRHMLLTHAYLTSESAAIFSGFNKRKTLQRWYLRTKRT